MQKNPEAASGVMVRKRDGRCVAFDAERIRLSIRRALESAGSEEPQLGDDLAAVVITYLQGHADGEQIDVDEIARTVQQVLVTSGCENAAYTFGRVREQRDASAGDLRIRPLSERDAVRTLPSTGGSPDEWSKGRVVVLLENEAELDPRLAEQVAAEVERGLFASGLRSVSSALVREWVDNELVLRGLPPRVGRHHHLSMGSHELRSILSGIGRTSPELETSTRLLSRYALREVYPPAVSRGHEQGLLHLGGLGYAGRVDSVALPRSQWVGAGPGDRVEPGRLALALRATRPLCAHELAVGWDGEVPTESEAVELLLGLAEPPGSVGCPVLCVPGDATVHPFLAAFEALRSDSRLRHLALPQLRVCEPLSDPQILAAVIEHETIDARIQFAAGLPEPGVVVASVSINIARLVLLDGRDIDALADRFERTLELALAALSARASLLERHAAVLPALGRATHRSPNAFGQPRRRLALGAVNEAISLIQARGVGGSDLLDELSERLRARGFDLAGMGAMGVELGMPDAVAARHFGRLDAVAHPEGKDCLELNADRDTFRYDGPVVLPHGADVTTLAEDVARRATVLGLPSTAVVPRCTGGTAERAAFVAAYLSALATPADSTSSCA